MRLIIDHRTSYYYDPGLEKLIQSYKLDCCHSLSQTVNSWSVNVSNGSLTKGFKDGAGNLIRTMNIDDWVSEVHIQVSGIVTTKDTNGVLLEHREVISPYAYLMATDLTTPNEALSALSKDLYGKNLASLDLAHQLSAITSETIAYLPGSTQTHHSAADVLKNKQGVCQDQTHVLITLARLHDLPARYVVGYLYNESDAIIKHEATHAWAEIYIVDLGWVGFDATNKICVDERYVRLCSGLDAFQATPIRGIISGQIEETMNVQVSVQKDSSLSK